MPKDTTTHWNRHPKNATPKFGKQPPRPQGALVLEIADRILPWVKENLKNVRDNDGMLVQLPTMRAIALNTAQLYLESKAS